MAKALQRSWPCLGRHSLPGHSCSCCSPPPASRAGTLCAECGSQLLSRSQILSPFVSIMSWSAFSLCLPMRAPSCVPFWLLPTWIQSSRLRLIERGASDAPCSILQADTLNGPASSACFIEWRVPGTVNLWGNRGLLCHDCTMTVYDLCQHCQVLRPSSLISTARRPTGHTTNNPCPSQPTRLQVLKASSCVREAKGQRRRTIGSFKA